MRLFDSFNLLVAALVAVGAFNAATVSATHSRHHQRDQRAIPIQDGVKEKLANVTDWIMTLGVANNTIHTEGLQTSIFINGNLARVLMASSKIFANSDYLEEGLKWCDTFCGLQTPIKTSSGLDGGWWDTGYNDLFIADTGTAVTALAVGYHLANPARRAVYLETLLKWSNFVSDGCVTAPGGGKYGTGCPPKGSGWIIMSGADQGGLGDGYYKGTINLPPYTISTATTGSCFFPHLAVIHPDGKEEQISRNAIEWILKSRFSNGSIPYIITPPDPNVHVYQSISYSAESFVAVEQIFPDSHAQLEALNSTIQFLIDAQNADGSWGELNSGDGQRSPRALTLLQWYYTQYHQNPDTLEAIQRYVTFILHNWDRYDMDVSPLVSGFVGLAFADLIQPWSTFGFGTE